MDFASSNFTLPFRSNTFCSVNFLSISVGNARNFNGPTKFEREADRHCQRVSLQCKADKREPVPCNPLPRVKENVARVQRALSEAQPGREKDTERRETPPRTCGPPTTPMLQPQCRAAPHLSLPGCRRLPPTDLPLQPPSSRLLP